ncbi:MAG: hypothetical protein JWQ43_1968 [Glaciihabitans sp.]|nr:hypothetical protein [Glaciihabitans sp.]
MHIDTHGTSLEEARRFLEAQYHGHDWVLATTDHTFSFRHTALGDADMTLRTSRLMGMISGEMAQGEDYIVSWLSAGHGTVDIGRSAAESVLGQPVVYPTDRPFSFAFTDIEQKAVHFHRPLLESIAAEQNGTAPGGLVMDHSATPSASSIRSWQNTLALVSRTTLDTEASPILQTEMARIAGIALLGMFPASSKALPAVLFLTRNARLRQAVEFIHANAHLPLTTTIIAEACDLSVRSLQESFQRDLTMSPTGYLRRIRLDRVRLELLANGPGSVSAVARKWGFAHLGRFAAVYEERFGELPHQTAGV